MKNSEDIINKALALNPGDKFIITCQSESESNYLLSDLKHKRNIYLKDEISEVEEIVIEKINHDQNKHSVLIYKKSPDFTKAFILKSNGEVENFDLHDNKGNQQIPDFDEF